MITNTRFNTNPLIVHAQGKLDYCPLWPLILDCWKKRTRPKYEKDSRLSIITWNSGIPNNINIHKPLGIFEESCWLLGIEPIALGSSIGKNWINRMKIATTIEFLATCQTQYVLGCDSADVLLLGDPAHILERYLQENCQMFFNAETVYWPDTLDMRSFENLVGQLPYAYFNSGVWIGETKFCLEFYKQAEKISRTTTSNPFSEQVCTKQAYRQLYPAVCADHTCQIFQTLNRVPITEVLTTCT